MIRKLTVEGFTVFPAEQSFSFEPGLNVIVGGNDSGKSHLIRLAYALSKWGSGGNRKELPAIWAEEKRLRLILLRVFGLRDLSELTSRLNTPCEAHIRLSQQGEKVPPGSAELGFWFGSRAEEDELHITTMPERSLPSNSICLGPREVLSVYPCYAQVGRRFPELLDAAGWDLCAALETEPSASPTPALAHVLHLIETLLRGQITRSNGRFQLLRPEQAPLELCLTAEGFKRIGTLGLLIANGSVRPGTTLLWDEPETNLNASRLPLLTDIIMGLCRAGVQVLLSTHSLFLLRELSIRLAAPQNSHLSRRYFGLRPSATGTRVSSADALSDLDPTDSMEAEAAQADRYLSSLDAI